MPENPQKLTEEELEAEVISLKPLSAELKKALGVKETNND